MAKKTKTPATPATPAKGNILAMLIAANASNAARGRPAGTGTDAILATKDGDVVLSTPHAASVRSLADDVYSGRTMMGTINGETGEFLIDSPASPCLARWSDLTPCGETNGKTYRARLISRVIVPVEGSPVRIVVLSNDVRDRLHAMGLDRPATETEKNAIMRLRKNRVAETSGTNVRGNIRIATATETETHIANCVAILASRAPAAPVDVTE